MIRSDMDMGEAFSLLEHIQYLTIHLMLYFSEPSVSTSADSALGTPVPCRQAALAWAPVRARAGHSPRSRGTGFFKVSVRSKSQYRKSQ